MGPNDVTMPDPSAAGIPQQPQVPQLLQRLQGVQQQAQQGMQPVPPVGPDQGSPVRRFLTNFFYGAGQSALAHVGLPTDYQKQQTAIQNNDRQQQLAMQAQQAQSMIGMHQQQLAQQQQDNAIVPIGKAVGQATNLDPTLSMPAKYIPALLMAGVKGNFQQGIADTKADASRDVAVTRTSAERDIAEGRTTLGVARLALQKQLGYGNLAARNASLAQRVAAKADNPTADRLKKADLADNAQGNLDGIVDDIKGDPNLFGKVAGHFTTAAQMMGSDDPAIARIGVRIHNYAMASNGVHGLRSAEAIPATENEILNHFRNSPQATLAGIGAARDSLNDFITDATLGKSAQTRHLAPTSSTTSGVNYAPGQPASTGKPANDPFAQFGGRMR